MEVPRALQEERLSHDKRQSLASWLDRIGTDEPQDEMSVMMSVGSEFSNAIPSHVIGEGLQSWPMEMGSSSGMAISMAPKGLFEDMQRESTRKLLHIDEEDDNDSSRSSNVCSDLSSPDDDSDGPASPGASKRINSILSLLSEQRCKKNDREDEKLTPVVEELREKNVTSIEMELAATQEDISTYIDEIVCETEQKQRTNSGDSAAGDGRLIEKAFSSKHVSGDTTASLSPPRKKFLLDSRPGGIERSKRSLPASASKVSKVPPVVTAKNKWRQDSGDEEDDSGNEKVVSAKNKWRQDSDSEEDSGNEGDEEIESAADPSPPASRYAAYRTLVDRPKQEKVPMKARTPSATGRKPSFVWPPQETPPPEMEESRPGMEDDGQRSPTSPQDLEISSSDRSQDVEFPDMVQESHAEPNVAKKVLIAKNSAEQKAPLQHQFQKEYNQQDNLPPTEAANVSNNNASDAAAAFAFARAQFDVPTSPTEEDANAAELPKEICFEEMSDDQSLEESRDTARTETAAGEPASEGYADYHRAGEDSTVDDEPSTEDEPTDDESAYEEQTNKVASAGEWHVEEPAAEVSADDEPTDDESAYEETVDDESANEEPSDEVGSVEKWHVEEPAAEVAAAEAPAVGDRHVNDVAASAALLAAAGAVIAASVEKEDIQTKPEMDQKDLPSPEGDTKEAVVDPVKKVEDHTKPEMEDPWAPDTTGCQVDKNISRAENHAQLFAFESKRRMICRNKLETASLQWRSSVDLLRGGIDEIDFAEELALKVLAAQRDAKYAKQASFHDKTMMSELEKELDDIDDGHLDSSTQGTVPNGDVDEATESSGELSKDKPAPLSIDIPKLELFKQTLEFQLNDMERLGDALVAELISTEARVVEAWKAYVSINGEQMGESLSMNTPPRRGRSSKSLKANSESPTSVIISDGCPHDLWVFEMRYRLAVVYQTSAWLKLFKELSRICELVREAESERRSTLRDLLLGVAFNHDVDEEVAYFIQDIIQKGAISAPADDTMDDCSDLLTMESALSSGLLRGCAILGKKETTWTRGRKANVSWHATLAVVTVDSFFHSFDMPTASAKAKSSPLEAFLEMVPRFQVPTAESIREGDTFINRELWKDLTPTDSVFIDDCTITAALGECEFQVNEKRRRKFGKGKRRMLSLRSASQEETSDFVRTLYGVDDTEASPDEQDEKHLEEYRRMDHYDYLASWTL